MEPGRHWARVARGIRPSIAAALALVWLLALAGHPSIARADGGAPNLLYIAGAGTSGGDLVIADIAKHQVTARIPIGGGPSAVALSGDRRFAYVTQADSNSLAIVDAHDQRVTAHLALGRRPSALIYDPVSSFNLLFASESGDDTVAMIDADKRQVLTRFHVGKQPVGLGLAVPGSGIASTLPSEAELYVADSGGDTVTVISTLNRKVVATIPVPGGPLSVTVPATGGVAYVGTRAGAIVALSLARHQVLGTLLRLPAGPIGLMDYDAVTGQIYAPATQAGQVLVLTPVSAGDGITPPTLPKEPSRTLAFAGGPSAVAITFDGAFGFVAEQNAGRVVMLDPSTRATLATLAVGGSPRALVTGAFPPVLSTQSANIAGILISLAVLAAIVAASIVIWLRTRKTDQTARTAAQSANGSASVTREASAGTRRAGTSTGTNRGPNTRTNRGTNTRPGQRRNQRANKGGRR